MDPITNIIVNGILLGLGIGCLIYQLKLVSKKLDEIIKEEHECKESLPYKFALKESVDSLWGRTDSIEAGLKYLEGKFNGK